jgi:hypothetical protein
LIASLFDAGLRVEDLQAVQVGYGGAALSTCARYFDAWVRTVMPAVRVTVAKEPGQPGLNMVRLLTRAGELTIVRGADHVYEVSGLGRQFRSPAPSTTEEALMREELSILGQDPVYERVLTA